MLAKFLRKLGQFNQTKFAPSLAILGIGIFIASFFFPPSIPVIIPLLIAASLVVSGGLALISSGFLNGLANKIENEDYPKSKIKKESKNKKIKNKQNELADLLKQQNIINAENHQEYVYYFRDIQNNLTNYETLKDCAEEDKNIKIVKTNEPKTVKQIKEIIATKLSKDASELTIYGRKLNDDYANAHFWEDKAEPKDDSKKVNPNKLYSVRFFVNQDDTSQTKQQDNELQPNSMNTRPLKISLD